MLKHRRIYFKALGIEENDPWYCEVCHSQGHDVHHIRSRGLGGNPTGDKDTIENLMGLCRTCHEKYGDISRLRSKLIDIHLKFLKEHGCKD